MRFRSLSYPLLNVDKVEMAAGEEFRFLEPAASASFGYFGLTGYSTMIEGVVAGRVFPGAIGWYPNDIAYGWSNSDLGQSDMLLRASDSGASWVCLSRNGSGERSIQYVSTTGTTMVPADTAFVVATGSVIIEGKTMRQLNYAAPRAMSFEVVGTADLLLVR